MHGSELTPRQADVLRFIVKYQSEYHRPPTVREIAKHLMVHPNAVFGHLAHLERKGRITRERNISRNITVLQ